jgi:hypothetical protein
VSYVGRQGAGEAERGYRALVERFRALVGATVPGGEIVLVVTRGDDALLRIRGRDARHFPQSSTGLYAGYHPADGAQAVEHLDALHAGGAAYLAIPATALWWLDHYPELRARLEDGGERVGEDPDAGVVYALERVARHRAPSRDELDAARVGAQAGALIRALLPDEDPLVVVGHAASAVDMGERRCWRLPAPGPAEGVEDVLAHAEAACREGARYVVLVEDDDPTRCIDGRLRGRLERSLRTVFSQRLAVGFEVHE